MRFLERWRRLPFLEPEKQRFVFLEIISVIIITVGCVTLLFTLIYESSLGGITQEVGFRVLRIFTGVLMILIGTIILLFFMYRHVSALELKLEDLQAPKEPEQYKGAIPADDYVEKSQRKKGDRERPLTTEELKAKEEAEKAALEKRIDKLDKSFVKMTEETTYKKCPMCGGLFTEDWDTCPKCGAKIR